MRAIRRTAKFKKDYKRMRKRGADMRRLARVVDRLAKDLPLPPSCRPHRLSGDWEGFWECHIAPDWLLIYQLVDEDGECELVLARTGSHADLFD